MGKTCMTNVTPLRHRGQCDATAGGPRIKMGTATTHSLRGGEKHAIALDSGTTSSYEQCVPGQCVHLEVLRARSNHFQHPVHALHGHPGQGARAEPQPKNGASARSQTDSVTVPRGGAGWARFDSGSPAAHLEVYPSRSSRVRRQETHTRLSQGMVSQHLLPFCQDFERVPPPCLQMKMLIGACTRMCHLPQSGTWCGQ
jgi:hypothetical protein